MGKERHHPLVRALVPYLDLLSATAAVVIALGVSLLLYFAWGGP